MASDAALRGTTALTACAILVTICGPAVLARRVLRQRAADSVPLVPFVSLLLLSHVWVAYGYVSRHYFPLFSLFALGEALACVYLAVYWRFTSECAAMGRTLAAAGAFMALHALYAVLGGLGYTNQSREGVATTLGCITDVVIVALNVTPARKVLLVLRTRSRVGVELPLTLSGLCANVSFIIYSFVARNWFILIPNVVAATLATTTVALYVRFRPSTHPVAAQLTDDSVCIDIQDDDKLAVSADGGAKAFVVDRASSSPTYEMLRSPLRPIQ